MAQIILYPSATGAASTGIDISSYIEDSGMVREREDIDGENAGRPLDGVMIRDVIGTKIKLTINLRPLTQSILSPILDIIEEEFCWVSYNDARKGWREKVKFYSNNNPATTSTVFPDGTVLFSGASFPLVEA